MFRDPARDGCAIRRTLRVASAWLGLWELPASAVSETAFTTAETLSVQQNTPHGAASRLELHRAEGTHDPRGDKGPRIERWSRGSSGRRLELSVSASRADALALRRGGMFRAEGSPSLTPVDRSLTVVLLDGRTGAATCEMIGGVQ